MSEKVNLDVDTTEADRKIDALDKRIEDTGDKLTKMGDDVESETQKSFNEVMGMMRASYMMVSGLAQAMGGTMGQVFSSIYSVAVAAIGTYKAVAAAMAASGVGAFQAALMVASLATAIVSLVGVFTGQEELSRSIGGLNMALHGISGMIDSFSL